MSKGVVKRDEPQLSSKKTGIFNLYSIPRIALEISDVKTPFS